MSPLPIPLRRTPGSTTNAEDDDPNSDQCYMHPIPIAIDTTSIPLFNPHIP